MSAIGGIDLGGTKVQAVVVNESQEVLGQARRPTPRDGGPPAVVAEMAGALLEAAAQAGVETTALSGIGVGSPGAVDGKKGTVAHARNLPDWEEPYPLASALEETLGTPAVIGNDVRVAVTAEFKCGAGKPYSSLLGVFWGTGIGGGIVLNGKPWLGRGAAGEIGHMVVRKGGTRCPCGRRGCLEAYAGRAAMEAKARRRVARGEKTKLFELMEKHAPRAFGAGSGPTPSPRATRSRRGSSTGP
jgi:glucokinase